MNKSFLNNLYFTNLLLKSTFFFMLFFRIALSHSNRTTVLKSVIMSSSRSLNLLHYDAVGLDFDNTLIQYNLSNLFQLHYSYLTNFLINKKDYHGLSTTMNEDDTDFIRRGLFMDFKCGNILDLSSDGSIITASHGTRKLSSDEIMGIYGEKRRWSMTDCFVNDKMALWEGKASEYTRTFLDYTDITGTLVFAKVVDLVDHNNLKSDYYTVWLDLLEAIIDMYKQDSDFSRTILRNMNDYIHKCDLSVIQFLQKLKSNGKLLLITGSSADTVKPVAEYSLGCGWEHLFHTVVYSAKKPSFFIGYNNFLSEDGNEVKINSLNRHYQRGNWSELYKIMQDELGRKPKCVYVGDNLIQDVYATTIATCPIDSISITEEMLSDGHFSGDHLHKKYLQSKYWGPYFGSCETPTIMGDIIMKYSKLCIPSVNCLADKPLNYEHIPFWETF